MKVASVIVRNESTHRPDGALALIDQKRQRALLVPEIPTLLSALEQWDSATLVLQERSARLHKIADGVNLFSFEQLEFLAPLPRSFSYLDGSAYLSHVERVRKARGAELPGTLLEVPLMYQGVSAPLSAHQDPIPYRYVQHGLDFEAEFAVLLKETPMGVSESDAEQYICFAVLMNDVSLRNLIPEEVGTGFGFVRSKPPSSFAPFALSKDELGGSWENHPVSVWRNGDIFGTLDGSEMHFSFGRLIAHAAETRCLPAGTIIGSGTVSNRDEKNGFGCIVEKRMQEIIEEGAPKTPFLQPGETVAIESVQDGATLFGRIEQVVDHGSDEG